MHLKQERLALRRLPQVARVPGLLRVQPAQVAAEVRAMHEAGVRRLQKPVGIAASGRSGAIGAPFPGCEYAVSFPVFPLLSPGCWPVRSPEINPKDRGSKITI